ncbi:hypothetical protein [Methylocystis sp.]|uniref:hypothetical protein n=1 Tax=Methylocystis sp. TaxID=1911079 RepID=UPI0025D8CC96|nr:hypothetical protein [Methylocystis sp.]
MAERLIGCREVFLNYAYAVIDLTLWLNVFVISCHDNVGNVQYQLEEVSGVCDPEFVNRARAAAIDFRLKGCSDPTLSGLFQFSEAVRTQYAIGAASLLRNPDPLRVRAMLGHESCGVSGEGVDKFKRSFIASMQSQMPDEISRVLAEAVFRALVLECEGVHIFFDLQSKLHEALNWTPPSLADAPAVLASVFGVLPSEYVTTVFGSGPLSEFKQTRGQGQSL